MIPTTEPTKLLRTNSSKTAAIHHRHRPVAQSAAISFQSRDSSPEIVMILGSLPYEDLTVQFGSRSFNPLKKLVTIMNLLADAFCILRKRPSEARS